MGQQRGLGLAVIVERGKPVVHVLVDVTVPGADDAQVDVGDGAGHGGVGGAVQPGVVGDDLSRACSSAGSSSPSQVKQVAA